MRATIGDRTFPAAAAVLHLFGTVCRSQYGHRRHCKFSHQTEDRAFCPVVQQLWLRASHCTDYHVTSLLFLRVTCPCSLRTYATLKFIRSFVHHHHHHHSCVLVLGYAFQLFYNYRRSRYNLPRCCDLYSAVVNQINQSTFISDISP